MNAFDSFWQDFEQDLGIGVPSWPEKWLRLAKSWRALARIAQIFQESWIWLAPLTLEKNLPRFPHVVSIGHAKNTNSTIQMAIKW